MKRFSAFVLAAVMALSVGATSAFAAPKGSGGSGNKYVDLNNDGICDNHVTGCTRPRKGTGNDYVDSDGDGICDNYQSNGTRSHDGTGKQHRKGHGKRR